MVNFRQNSPFFDFIDILRVFGVFPLPTVVFYTGRDNGLFQFINEVFLFIVKPEDFIAKLFQFINEVFRFIVELFRFIAKLEGFIVTLWLLVGRIFRPVASLPG